MVFFSLRDLHLGSFSQGVAEAEIVKWRGMQALPKKTAVEVRAVFQRVIVLRSIGAAPVGVSVFSWLTYYFCGDNGDGSCFSSAGLPLQPKKTKKSTVHSPQLPGKVFQDLVHSDCNILQIDSVQQVQ